MSVAKLNVEIATRLDNLQGGLNRAKRMLARFGKDLQAQGENLTFSLTAPIAALGVAAVRAAGEYESLRLAMQTTMQDAGRSISEANAEVEALRKAALAPGLDFEQAVRASIRLQNVGYNAEQARKIVTELANAITMSGGTAEDLDGVTKQFAQMISKGRVLQEDLSIISERMPKIAELSKKAFGSFNAEALRAKGISAQQFVAGITLEMEKLKRVEGGISNSIVNAGSAVKQFLGRIGEEINKAFNLGKKAESFSTFLDNLATKFEGLDAPTKRFIVNTALVVAATGPAIKVFGVLSSTLSIFPLVGGKAVSALRFLSETAVSAKMRFDALNASSRMLVAGGGIIALVAIAAAVGYSVWKMSQQMTVAEHAAQALAEVQSQAQREIAGEKVEVERLVRVLHSDIATRKEKEQALAALKVLNKDIFKDLSLEAGGLDKVNEKMAAYISLISKRAQFTAANQKLVEIEGKLLDSQTRLQEAGPSGLQTTVNLAAAAGVKMLALAVPTEKVANLFGKMQDKDRVKNFKEQETALLAQKDAMLKTIEALTKEGVAANTAATANDLFSGSLKKGAAAAAGKSEAVQKTSERLKEYKAVLDDIAAAKETGKVFGDAFNLQTEAIEKGIQKLLDGGFKAADKEIQGLLAQWKALNDSVNKGIAPEIDRKTGLTPVASVESAPLPKLTLDIKQPEGLTKAKDAMLSYIETARGVGEANMSLQENTISIYTALDEMSKVFAASMATTGNTIKNATLTAAGAMVQLASAGSTSFREVGKAALKGAADVVRAAIMQGVAATVSKMLIRVPPPFNVAAAAAAGAAAGIMFNKALAALKIPALAKGGVLTGPSLVLAGEYAGARSNPEVIAPLNTLQGMLGGSEPVIVGGTLRASGRELVVVLENERKWSKRL